MDYSSFLFDEEKEFKPNHQSLEEIKNSQDIESFLNTNLKYNNVQHMLKFLTNFSKKEKNEYLNEMIYDLINYNKEYEKETNHFTIKKNASNFKYKLYKCLQKNLFEVVNVENKEKRKEIIDRIYRWYQDKMKCFNELKYITKKTYMSSHEFDDEKYVNDKFKSLIQQKNIFISQADKIKNDMNHRSIEIFDKKLLEDFKTKHILDANSKKVKYKINPFLQSSRSIKVRKNNLSSKVKNINTENNISLPLLNYSLLQIDKKLMENKNKMIMEKRNQENIKNNIEQFGVNRAKYKSSSLNKYEIKKLVNSYIKDNNFSTLFINKNKHKIKNERYINENKIENDNEINEELSKTKTKLKLDISHIINLNKDKNDIDNNEMTARGMKRMKSQFVKISRDIFKKMGKKIILEDIKNLNYKTNKIKDQEKIIYKEISLKSPTNKINNEKVLLNKCTKFKKLPSDSLSKLYFHNDIFKQKIFYKKLINISTKKEEKNETNINEKLLDKNIFGDRYELIDDNSKRNVGKFNLSAYNMNNLEKIKNFKNNMNLKNIETKENTNNNKIYKINNVYKLYKNNYLNLRKSISSFRRKEYEGLLNKISKCKSCENEESQKNDKDNIDTLYNLNDKLLFKNKISNLIKDKKHKYLSSAILNPDESNNFSQYYLPRSGSMLLTREKVN